LKEEFKRSQLLEDFEYGIYDCFTDSIVFGSKISFKPGREREQAKQIHKLEDFEPDGHYFGVVFPNRSSFILQQLDFWMYSSIVIILIIIFFSYTIYVILQQKRLSEIRTDFVNNMTHELKTPISTIGLSAEAIVSPSVSHSPERIKQYVNIIRNENARLRSQVDRVLQIASLSPRRVELSQEVINMHELIQTAALTFNVQAADKDGSLNVSLLASNFQVKGDRVHLTNVVYNLLDNAIKYSPDHPQIFVNTFNKDHKLVMTIQDNGIGIQKANQKLIFEKFYRVPTGDLHAVRGFGLGLFYVKTILKAHGGSISLESEPGKGSTFQIQLKHV